MKNRIINYTVNKKNDDYSQIIDSRTSIEKNENILDTANEYNVQVKNFKLNVNLPLLSLTSEDTVAVLLTGDQNQSLFEKEVVINPTSFNEIEDLVLRINLALIVSTNTMRSNNPILSGSIVTPLILFNANLNRYVLIIPEDFNTSPLSFHVYFSPKIARVLQLGYLDSIFQQIPLVDKEYYRVESNSYDQTITIGADSFYIYSNRDPEYTALTDNDSLVIVAHSIPINGSLEHQNKRVETQILKQYKLTSSECINNTVLYNQSTPDYYELISHYPLSRIDIELYVRKVDGKLYPIELHSQDSYSVDLEFIKV